MRTLRHCFGVFFMRLTGVTEVKGQSAHNVRRLAARWASYEKAKTSMQFIRNPLAKDTLVICYPSGEALPCLPGRIPPCPGR